MLTNHHVLGNADAASQSEAEFGYEHDVDGVLRQPVSFNPVSLYQLKQNTLGIHLHDFFLLLPKTSRPKKLSISRIDGSSLSDGTYWCLFELPSSENGIGQPAYVVLR